MWLTKNSGRIAIQWFHMRRCLDYQYSKFQLYAIRVQKCVFARYATLVPRLYCILTVSEALYNLSILGPYVETHLHSG